ncbi:MAG TPA: hypothetical protein VJH97_02720 [Candidatus Nanoarchaeia archaeon]|nr:hypothetical protein [Candidatus Nanoarchaeia archaeon]
MMKAQIIGTPFIYIMFTFVAIGVIVAGIIAVHNLENASRATQLANFQLSLQNKVKSISTSVNSVSQETFALPPGIESVCFIGDEDFVPYTNKKVTENKIIYADKNLFFEPVERFSPRAVSNIAVDQNPLCLKVIDGKLSIYLQGLGNETKIIPADNAKPAECVSVKYSTENAIDIVFLGYNYNTIPTFAGDVSRYVNDVFLATEPYNSSQEKFNFYRVDDFSLSCSIVPGFNYIDCDSYQTNLMAANCPHDYIVVLADRNQLNDVLNPVRSSQVGNTAKVNTADNKDVLIHEFGHQFGLADEYIVNYPGFDPDAYPNCGTSCKWNSITGQCYGTPNPNDNNGCSIDTAYRGTATSIMKELYIHEYGPINEDAIRQVLDAYG